MSKVNKETILIIVAHPDDEVIGCGATIAWHTKRGDRVAVIFMADGVTSRYYNPIKKLSRAKEVTLAQKDILRRKQEAGNSSAILGIKKKDLFFMNFADQRLDTYAFLDLTKRIEMVKSSLAPTKVFTHFWNDLNLDHQIVCRAVLTAFRPVPGKDYVSVYQMEIPESTFLSVPSKGKDFLPDLFVDVYSTFSLKLKALKAYESESRLLPHPRSEAYIRFLACQRGREAGLKMAEAFQASIISNKSKTLGRLK